VGEGQLRCCFCGNLMSAEEDATLGGRATAAQRGLARAPGEAPAPPLVRDAGSSEVGREMMRAELVWKVVIAVVALISGVVYLLLHVRC